MNIDGDRSTLRCVWGMWLGFNGAVDEHRRSPPVAAQAVSSLLASMEPSMNIDGDKTMLCRLPHGLHASMEPSMNIDGDIVPFLGTSLEVVASMEPSMNIDGDRGRPRAKLSGSYRFNGAVDEHRRRPANRSEPAAPNGELQWSRR